MAKTLRELELPGPYLVQKITIVSPLTTRLERVSNE